ncbi:MAG: FeoB-associated Cys-rich membrane protein [Puniceicoccales bacterium]|jgi:hypothetical protein|nr:FeoB-associated Cys-rich membrane protein [Puniceicoccales bacterium]
MTAETLVIALLVSVAVFFTARHAWRLWQAKGDSCNCGCAGCGTLLNLRDTASALKKKNKTRDPEPR